MPDDMTRDSELRARIGRGELIEREEVTDEYRRALCTILTVSGDTELMSAPSYWHGMAHAPTTNTRITELAIIQDELGHAHLAYRLLADLGVDTDDLVYDRAAERFKNTYAFDLPLESWTELVVANAFWDRAGYTLLGDVYHHTSYAPWKRALVKVDKEQFFHVRQGENWFRHLAADPAAREDLQRAVDWMFPVGLEFFGLPDSHKEHSEQIEYRLKSLTNDQLRQVWLQTVVPFCEQNGIRVPAHHDAASDAYVLDFPFPCAFDPEARRWDFSRQISPDEVLARWRRRGPALERNIAALRAGRRTLAALGGAGRR